MEPVAPDLPARLAATQRPPGWPLMRQQWGRLVFMHWPVPAAVLRPLVPARLSIDTYAGQAWVALVPFRMWGIRPLYAPPVPGLAALTELNVRTYVHLDGRPGVWFCSLDASLALGVWAARTLFHLPYLRAQMTFQEQGDELAYTSRRTHPGAPPATFAARFRVSAPLPTAPPDSLPYFLTERYALYTADARGRLYYGRLHHPPWALRTAELLPGYQSTLLEGHGLVAPPGPPLLHYGHHTTVDVWPLRRV